jgi:hypothetical protein
VKPVKTNEVDPAFFSCTGRLTLSTTLDRATISWLTAGRESTEK